MPKDMVEKQIKAVEKIMAEEAKADQKRIAKAEKELKAAEKLYKASVKETEKAEKALEKAGKSKIKTEKALQKAQKLHSQSASELEKAERHVEEVNKREDLAAQDVQQRHGQVTEHFEVFHEHEGSRIQQRSEMVPTAGGVVEKPEAA